MVMSLVLWIFQFFLASFVFRDRQFPNISVSIDNRRLHSIMSYFFFFFNILMGVFSCLGRILKGLALGLIFVSRIDRTSLMLGFQQWDRGFVAYLGFLHVLVAHRHPVMLVFCELLSTREGDPKSGQSLELSKYTYTYTLFECRKTK
ncbi:stimulated by retinoic acid gene 6 protein-like [Orbicella faveolata]|uniref:stimulated by retinoic acid gene 6 protein-like n=1 Tax=Orbicella faveolata TaxID=48498 RepID=UPI0009E419AE|nr:stimulated by retinoic acid gene 6 protein-like [Orbicella faveolata]